MNPASMPDASAHRPGTPRLALTMAEAAESLGVSADFLREHIMGELRIVRRGRKKLVAVSELERWLKSSAAVTLEADR